MRALFLFHAFAGAPESPTSDLPVDGAAPLDADGHRNDGARTPLPVEGARPLDTSRRSSGAGPALPPGGAEPLGSRGGADDSAAVEVASPLRAAERERRPLSPRGTLMTRIDVMTGPMWRTRDVDAWIGASVESGATHGFSGAFAFGVLPASSTQLVRAVDVPIGVGAVARGRLRRRPFYASVGLLAGVLVHRANVTDVGIVHRVDPDIRLPIRFAWTAARIGFSFAIEQGFSVRHRTYERRGAVVWSRNAYRVGMSVGLHWDIVHRQSKVRRPRRERS